LYKDNSKTNAKSFTKVSENELTVTFEELPPGNYVLYILNQDNSYVNFKTVDDSKFEFS